MKRLGNAGKRGIVIIVASCAVVACGDMGKQKRNMDSYEVVLSTKWSVAVAYSNNHHVALVRENIACVVNSFEVSVSCVDPVGAKSWNVGVGEGDGPGEFRTIGTLVRGAEDRLGLVDLALSRISVFDVQGDLVATTRIPSLFRPVREFDDTIEGTAQVPGVAATGGELYRIDLSGGDVLEVVPLVHPHEAGLPVEAVRGLSHGAMDANGLLWFGTGMREIVGYYGDGRLFGVAVAPRWTPEGPSEDEVQVFSRTPLFGQLPSSEDIADFAREPQRYLVPGRALVADDRGRVWALTHRRSFSGSSIDVYRNGELVGTAKTAGRALGLDVLGDHIVVLEEYGETDDEGLHIRMLSWYVAPEV